MRFFNLDLHIGVIGDIRHIFANLGHQVTDWTLSGQAWALGRALDRVDVISRENWQKLDQAMCDAFHDRYRNELAGYHGFIVTHTPSFALLYEKFRKPIIVVASTRYEHPFSGDAARWTWLNDVLCDMRERGLLFPIANNKYDAAYAKAFTGFEWRLIPSLCEYVDAPARLERQKFVLWGYYMQLLDATPSLVAKRTIGGRPPWAIRRVKRLLRQPVPKGYTWRELAAYSGMVHMPYNASQMAIFEQYTSNFPLFFPTKSYLRDLFAAHAEGVLSQLSHNQHLGLPPRSVVPVKRGSDPNAFDDLDNMMRWVDLADFYDETSMPHLTYFASPDDLRQKLASADLAAISARMALQNASRREAVYGMWRQALADI